MSAGPRGRGTARDPTPASSGGPAKIAKVKAARIGMVIVMAGVAFVIAATLIAANARPNPESCNDTATVEAPGGEPMQPTQPAPMCAAPEAPA